MARRSDTAFCFLAYGVEHTNEFNSVAKEAMKYGKVIACTDDMSGIKYFDAVVQSSMKFNFNLKRRSVERAFIDSSVVILMDTDISFLSDNVDLSFVDEIEDGIYVLGESTTVQFMGKTLDIDSWEDPFMTSLNNLNDTGKDIRFMDECIVIIKASEDKVRHSFIRNWNDIFDETECVQPSNGLPGAMEGLIIYLSALKSGLPVRQIYDNAKMNAFVQNLYHYRAEVNMSSFYENKIVNIV